ncbi:MAG: phosphatidate cytidylyltransferase [Planctomycetes bacterium]|nr:phosphatidate cytidylyltransferase [Planctomycetota bacterium]
MLKHRLFFGTLITVLFSALVIVDGWMDGSFGAGEPLPVQGTLLCCLLCLVQIPAHLELAGLAQLKGIRIPVTAALIGSMVLASASYWQQFLPLPDAVLSAILAFSFLAIVVQNYQQNGFEGMLVNCGGGALSIIYLGLLASFLMSIRVHFGLWPLVMTLFVVKSADIGAYTVGRVCGRHKFAPRISPGKTWEGMLGAVLFGVIVSVIFADRGKVMAWQVAVMFGICFAFIGQMGDLVESMMKRDAQIKDSSSRVPGFGGVLDIVDSPLVSAPFAYCFLSLSSSLTS